MHKILLIISVYYMNPVEKKLQLLWMDEIPQESLEQCKNEGDKYEYRVEVNEHIEVQYICKSIK